MRSSLARRLKHRAPKAARLLGVTADELRDWERNGLVRVLRDATSGYRLYDKTEQDRLLVIRALRRAR